MSTDLPRLEEGKNHKTLTLNWVVLCGALAATMTVVFTALGAAVWRGFLPFTMPTLLATLVFGAWAAIYINSLFYRRSHEGTFATHQQNSAVAMAILAPVLGAATTLASAILFKMQSDSVWVGLGVANVVSLVAAVLMWMFFAEVYDVKTRRYMCDEICDYPQFRGYTPEEVEVACNACQSQA